MKPLPEDEVPKRKTSFTEAFAGFLCIVVMIALCLYGLFRCSEDAQVYNDRRAFEFKEE